MPIVSANAANIWQHCAACGANNRIAISSLELGAAAGSRVDPNAVVLPACDCGAREVLVRTWDTCPAELQGSHLDLHRKAVNGLAKELKDTGKSHAAVLSIHNAETESPPNASTYPFTAVDPPLGAPAAKPGRQ